MANSNETKDHSIIKSDKSAIETIADSNLFDDKIISLVNHISAGLKANARFRLILLLIIGIAILSILFVLGFIGYHVYNLQQVSEVPLAAMEIRSLNRVEVLMVEMPVTYQMSDENVSEIVATTGYGVYTADLSQAEIEETDKYIRITMDAPELSTVDIYANQTEVIYRGESSGIGNAFKQLFNGNSYSDGFI